MPELFELPDQPCPPGAAVSEIASSEGARLRLAHWPARAGTPRGAIVLMQGRSEAIEKYYEVIEDLLARDFAVLAFDWRGQGGSSRALADPRRGHVDDFRQYVADLDAVLRHAAGIALPRPWFGIAHSMGGAVAILALAAGETRLARVVLSTPLAGLAGLRAPRAARALASALDVLGLGGSYVPGGGATALATRTFENNLLTHDRVRYERAARLMAEHRAIAIGDPTIGWVAAMFRAFDTMAHRDFGKRITTPTLMITAGADRLVSTPAAQALAHRLRLCRLIDLPGARHELMFETDDWRDLFFAAVDAFLPGETPDDPPEGAVQSATAGPARGGTRSGRGRPS
jgi:lysophospholipase